MVLNEGDVIYPKCLVLLDRSGEDYVGVKGEVFLSGAKLWTNVDGTNMEVITSA